MNTIPETSDKTSDVTTCDVGDKRTDKPRLKTSEKPSGRGASRMNCTSMVF
jgi:hypothetical protein